MSIAKKANGHSQVAPYDPWRDLFDLESNIPANWMGHTRSNLPAVNVSENDKSFFIEVIAPGFKKEDFYINMEDEMLTINAESRQETTQEDKQYSRREYSFSSFTRSFKLPEDVKDDQIKANYSDGILKIEVPKTEQKAKKSKEININ